MVNDQASSGTTTKPPRIPELADDVSNLSAAQAYADAGIYVLPTDPADIKNPGSRVGKRWQDKSSRSAEVIAAWFSGTSDGIAIDLGRSGLVVIDVDHPEKLPGWLAAALESSGVPFQSTRRSPTVEQCLADHLENQPLDRWLTYYLESKARALPEDVIASAAGKHSEADIRAAVKRLGVEVEYEGMPRRAWWTLPVSYYETLKETVIRIRRGHFVFRQLPGRRIGCGKGRLGNCGLDVKGDGGVIIVQPSQHRDGGEYRWQRCGEIPVLPVYLAEMLDDAGDHESAATDVEVIAFKAEHTASIAPWKMDGWINHWDNATRDHSSRHDTMVEINPWAYEEVRLGYVDASTASDWMRKVFVEAKTREYNGSAPMSEARANAEYDGIEAWAIAQAMKHPIEDLRKRRGDNGSGHINLGDGATEDESDRNTTDLSATVIGLENGFWDSRESLQLIYETALARMTSPWAVLACCVARVLTGVRPHVTLPPVVGGPGSLNWIAALVSRSGGGKGAANAVARDLMSTVVCQRNLGSGEGLVDAFYQKVGKDTVRREAVLFMADEVDTVKALQSRSGSTLAGTICSAFSGETLGFGYRSNGNHVDAHTYRMTMVVSVQPAKAGALIDDRYGGTPQRIMWFPADDPRIDTPPEFVPSPVLTVTNSREWNYRREIIIPDVARAFIIDHRIRANRGEVDGLDGHAVFCREKFAFALAVLEGRVSVSEQDWELSGIAAAVSDATRAWMLAELNRASAEEAAELGRRRGVTAAAAEEEKTHQDQRRTTRIHLWIADKLREAGDGGMLWGRLQAAGQRRDGPYLRAVISAMHKEGLVTVEEVTAANGKKAERWRIVL